jgi:hypothetical protein
MEVYMKSFLRAGIAALALTSGVALAQTATETTTTQTTAVPAVPPPPLVVQQPIPAPLPPPAGTLSSTRETRTVDAYGNPVVSRGSTYRDSTGVAQDSQTTTTTVPVAPPPPPVTTTTTTQTTNTGPQ